MLWELDQIRYQDGNVFKKSVDGSFHACSTCVLQTKHLGARLVFWKDPFSACLPNFFSSRQHRKKMESASSCQLVNLVCTKGRRKYKQAFVHKLSTPVTSQGSLSSCAATDKLTKPITSQAVCSVAYASLPAEDVANYTLERKPTGEYAYVHKLNDGLTFEVYYFNAELKRCIPLGRYTDPATASLAHALARDPNRPACRVNNFAAQDVIQSIFATTYDATQQEIALPDPMPVEPSESSISHTELLYEGVDILSLLE